MKPGRELDRLVAEKIFGGTGQGPDGPYRMVLCEYEATGRRENREGTVSDFCRKCGEPYGYHDKFPRYSTDISSAWEVVARLNTLGWEVTVHVGNTQPSTGMGQAVCSAFRLKAPPNPEREIEVSSGHHVADTPQLAICLCALKVSGVSEGSPPTP